MKAGGRAESPENAEGADDARIGRFDALVLGAGAAGLFCARQAARSGLAVALVDHQARAGRKLALAGGGMGNVTNRTLDARHYVGADPSFCRAAFRRFGTDDVLRLLDELAIPWEERDFGQIFCLRPARALADGLERQGREAGVDFALGGRVDAIRREAGPDGASTFSLRAGGRLLSAPRLVVATGSPACPQAGATDFGSRLAARWGLGVAPFRPVLAPLIMPETWPLHGLAGISLDARLSVLPAGGGAERPDPCGARPLLFTHRGLSGPAALAASCLWREGDALNVDFLPGEPVASWLHAPANGKLRVGALLARRLPDRLAERLCPPDLARRKAAEVGGKDAVRLADAVHRHRVIPAATEGPRKAEAASGGVLTAGLDSRLQSRRIPGLFFCGEVLDVTGLLGGYNLHWAFASAHLVAEALRGAAARA